MLSTCLGNRACFVLAFFIMFGCAENPLRIKSVTGEHDLRGIASWYGPSFHGKPTANGEPYNMWALTAAHRTLPFGTQVLVQSVDTGRSVIVRINDRGPFIRGRVIDLSYEAAREIGMIGKGTDQVVLTILGQEGSPDSQAGSTQQPKRYWVQAGSFTTLGQAFSLKEELAKQYPHVRVMSVALPSGQWHRVQIGAYSTSEMAKTVAKDLMRRYHLDPLLLQDN